MGVATAPSAPASPYQRTAPGRAHWLRAARETADDLATDAATREQAGKVPFDEVSRLREAGLLALLVLAGQGGGGADWSTAYAVVREIAAADGAIAQLLGCHYFLGWSHPVAHRARSRPHRSSGSPWRRAGAGAAASPAGNRVRR